MPNNENLAILISDIAGFTERMSTRSRDDMSRLLDWHDATLRRIIEFYEGQWIKSTGDGVLAVFRSPTNAMHCGMAIQDAIAEYNYERPEPDQFHVRIALNVGEVRWVGEGDISGEAVNLVSRIEGETPVDEVWFSDAMYLVMNKAEVPSEKVGERSFKGIPEPVRIYRVPCGEAVRLVGTGEKMQIEGVPYPFGGMPRPDLNENAPSAKTSGSKVHGSASAADHTETKGSGFSNGKKAAAAVGVLGVLLVAGMMQGEGDNDGPVGAVSDPMGANAEVFPLGEPVISQPEPKKNNAKDKPVRNAGVSMAALQGEWVIEEDGMHLIVQGTEYRLFQFGTVSDGGVLNIQGNVIYASSMMDGMTYPFSAQIKGNTLQLTDADGEKYSYRRIR